MQVGLEALDEACAKRILEEEGFFEPSCAFEDLLDQTNEDVLVVLVEDRVDGLVDLNRLTFLPLWLEFLLLLLFNLILHDYFADDSSILLPIEPRDPLLPQIFEQVDPFPIKLLPRKELIIGPIIEVICELIQGKVAFELILDNISDGLGEICEICSLALEVVLLLLQGYEVYELVLEVLAEDLLALDFLQGMLLEDRGVCLKDMR